MLEQAEHEPEALFIYGFLAETASAAPNVFIVL